MQEKENFLEIEKKFELTPEEYKKISTQLTKAIHEKIEDIYYDTPVYDLTKK
jgi:inorganic triphosphatase YgiF